MIAELFFVVIMALACGYVIYRFAVIYQAKRIRTRMKKRIEEQDKIVLANGKEISIFGDDKNPEEIIEENKTKKPVKKKDVKEKKNVTN